MNKVMVLLVPRGEGLARNTARGYVTGRQRGSTNDLCRHSRGQFL